MSKYIDNIEFDYLLVLLGLDSNIRPDDVPDNTYLIYKIENIAKEYLKK